MRPCCVSENLRRAPSSGDDRVVRACVVCGARHIAMTVDPIVMQLRSDA